MRLSLKQYLTEIAPYSDENILNPNFFLQAERISMLFSNCCSNFIIEIPVGKKEKTLDFSLCILRTEIAHLLKHWSTESLSVAFNKDTLWNNLFHFCKLWNSPSLPLYNNISNVWFEFDNPKLKDPIPSPSFFFSPASLHKMFFPKVNDTAERLHQNINWLYEPVLSLLFGPYLTDKVKTNLSRCIDLLPKYGIVFQIGVMAARRSSFLRVCTSIPFNGYIDYLERIGWTGDLGYLNKILKSVGQIVDSVLLDIDVGEYIAPTAGIECSFNNKPGIEAKTKRLLAFLVDSNLCIQEKADSIQTWMDFKSHQPGCRSKASNVQRMLSHIKLSLSPNRSLAAKAYLCFSGNPQ